MLKLHFDSLCVGLSFDGLHLFVADLNLHSVGAWDEPLLGLDGNLKEISLALKQILLGELKCLVLSLW